MRRNIRELARWSRETVFSLRIEIFRGDLLSFASLGVMVFPSLGMLGPLLGKGFFFLEPLMEVLRGPPYDVSLWFSYINSAGLCVKSFRRQAPLCLVFNHSVLVATMKLYAASSVLLAAGASAQQGAWAQCTCFWFQFYQNLIDLIGGGTGWNGGTTCIAGYTCTYSNPYYSQCLPGGPARKLRRFLCL